MNSIFGGYELIPIVTVLVWFDGFTLPYCVVRFIIMSSKDHASVKFDVEAGDRENTPVLRSRSSRGSMASFKSMANVLGMCEYSLVDFRDSRRGPHEISPL